jgi:hypothetical protein
MPFRCAGFRDQGATTCSSLPHWSAGRDSNSVRAGLQSAASSTSASGALSKNLVAEERVELSCPKALVPKTRVSPDCTTRPNCFGELTNYSKSAAGMITQTLD